MDQILKSLHDLEGVNGTIVADERGQLLASRAHSVYDDELLRQVALSIVAAVDSVKLLQEAWELITCQFTEGKLLIRNLGETGRPEHSNMTLTIIADSRINLSFANVAIRVAVPKIRAAFERGIQSPGPTGAAHSPAPAQAAPNAFGGHTTGFGSSNATLGLAPTPEVAASGLTWSGLSGSSNLTGSTVSVANAASSTFLTTCTKALAMKVGPMAKLFVKEAAVRVSPNRPFSMDSAGDLIAELSKHLKTPADVAQFRLSVQKPI